MNVSDRFLQAFAVLKDPSFGSLWWVTNQLWKNNKNFVVKEGTENHSHPGVSLRASNAKADSTVPMLLGTSKKKSPKEAVAFKLDDNTDRLTYFGALKPMGLAFPNFLNGDIVENKRKKFLSADDQKQLEVFIRKKFSWK